MVSREELDLSEAETAQLHLKLPEETLSLTVAVAAAEVQHAEEAQVEEATEGLALSSLGTRWRQHD